jgi:asparagine synthase (glutamine-hydrolysing)
MCGIYGRLGHCSLLDQITVPMGSAINHRGPDDRGNYRDQASHLELGHNRLSIIDLSAAGHQPMINENATVIIAFNGEIYNFQALRAELSAEGHEFRSRTDTEVLVHGYEQWGKQLVERLYGMFAFGIWDAVQKTLLLARDPMGMKPLYYWVAPDKTFWFASEIKAFLAIPEFKPKLDRKAISQYLEFNFVYDTERCTLEGIRKLPAGHTMTVRAGSAPKISRYFTPPPVDPCDNSDDAIDLDSS